MERVINTVFVNFTQNNSGGYFIIDEEKGIGHYIVVEGINLENIKRRFEEITEDFSEYCSCCGERWCSYIVDEDLTPNPTIYGKDAKRYVEEYGDGFLKECFVFVHYIDGSIEKIHKVYRK